MTKPKKSSAAEKLINAAASQNLGENQPPPITEKEMEIALGGGEPESEPESGEGKMAELAAEESMEELLKPFDDDELEDSATAPAPSPIPPRPELPELPEDSDPEEASKPEPEKADAPEIPADPTESSETEPSEFEAMLEEIDNLRKENRVLRENGKEGLKIDPKLWDIKHKAAQLEEENQRQSEIISELTKQLEEKPEKEEISWAGKDVRVLLPVYKFINPMTHMAIVAAALELGAERMGHEMEMGDGMIYNARNRLADRFMKTGANWALWLDDDMVLPFGRVATLRYYTGITQDEMSDALLSRHFIKRLMESAKRANTKIIGGTYFGRRKLSPPMFGEGMRNREVYNKSKNAVDEIVPTDWMGTGCILVHRDVFLDIQKKFPELAPRPEAEPNMQHWDYFLPSPGRGEDVAFCQRAKAAGHQPMVDLGMQCLHVGYMAYGKHNTSYPPLQ